MKQTKQPIIIIGGHLAPAVAVAECWNKAYPDIPIVFIGRKTFFKGVAALNTEVQAIGVFCQKTYAVTAARSGSFPVFAFFSLLYGIFQSFVILLRSRPSCIITFGGYVAVPVSLAAFFLKIPIITHEQTHVMGKANLFISRFASDVCLTFPDTKGNIRPQWFLTGLPVRARLFESEGEEVSVSLSKPLLYVTGGTTGAKSLNDILFPIIPRLLDHFSIIHQTGPVSYKEAQSISDSLPKDKKNYYVFAPYFNTDAVSWIYRRAHIVFGRSGSNTVYELALLGIPAILVPLPWSIEDEQTWNADWLSVHGGAMTLHQESLTPERIYETFDSMRIQHDEYKEHARKFAQSLSKNGAQEMVKVISKYAI